MLPDIEQMTINELEKFLISRSDRIKAIAGGKRVLKKDIAAAIGVYHDPIQTKALYEKLKHVSCLQRHGRFYDIVVDAMPVDVNEIIDNDPEMRLMNDVIDEALNVTPQRDLELHYSDSSPYPCKYCLFFENAWCEKKQEKRNPDDRPCDEFEVDLDKMGVGPRSWYKKKKRAP